MRNKLILCGFIKRSAGFAFMVLIITSEALKAQTPPPSPLTLYSNKVTYLSSNTPTTPIGGTGTTFFVGRESTFVFGGPSINFNYRSLLQFNLADIHPSAIITSATLTLTRSGGVNPMQIIFARAATAWAESTATWNNQPAYQSTDEISITAPTTSILTVDVKSHIQKMVSGVYINNGWVLRGSTESGTTGVNRHYYSDHYSVAASRPRLDITYYIPMSVASAAITHSSGSSISDGSISPILANGPGGTYTYRWYNSAGTLLSTSASTPNLSNVSSGWYGLQVTSSVAGTDPFYYAFLIGANCSEVPIEFNPGPNYIDDAVLSGPSFSTQAYDNYGTESSESALDMVFFGSPTENRTLIRFRLWVDPLLDITESEFVLKGFDNSNSRSNVARLKRVTTNWHENIVTHSSMPGSSSDILVNIPEMTSMTETKSINIIDFWEYWKQNNTSNYGFLFELQLYNGIHAAQRYHSSDVAAGNRPKINFKVGIYSSECFSSYSAAKRKLDGGYSVVVDGKLKFTMNEEYQLSASKYLPFKIYDKNQVIMEGSDISGVMLNGSIPPLPLRFNDNRWEINISSIPGMIVGEYYTLELLNSKGEKRYLRFLYNS